MDSFEKIIEVKILLTQSLEEREGGYIMSVVASLEISESCDIILLFIPCRGSLIYVQSK